MPSSTPTIFIVDHERSVRASLAALMLSRGWHAESFASAADFLTRRAIQGPSCILLDDTLPDADAVALVGRLASERSDMPIIMIAGHGDVPATVRAMKAGAVDFLMKPLTDELVLTAVREAVERSDEALKREAELRELRARYASLSGRERQVMGLVVAGLLNKQVGGRLGISEITVKAHRGKVMRKIGADSLAALVSVATVLQLMPMSVTPARPFSEPIASRRITIPR